MPSARTDTPNLIYKCNKDTEQYLGMKYTVTFDKYHLDGIAEGLTITETMNFVDWDDACDWADKVTMNVKVPYVILEMRGPNGEKEMF